MVLFFKNFRDDFIFSGTPGQGIKIWNCPGQSGMYGMYASTTKRAQSIAWGKIWPCPGVHKFYLGSYRENLPNLAVPSHKA